MHRLLLLTACITLLPARTNGQQTDATYLVTGASITMTSSTLASAGLPSYSQLTLTDQSGVSIGVSACPAGAFSLDDAQVCTLCPAGKFSTSVTAVSSATCVSCEAGKYSLAVGASSSSTCTDCQNGTYSETVGASLASVCLSCPANSSSFSGSKLLQACWCTPGHFGPNGAACSPCNSSVWCLWGQVYPCPPNSLSSPMSSSLAQCLCRPGYYGDVTMGGPDLTLCQVHTHTFRIVRGFNGPTEGHMPSEMLRRSRLRRKRGQGPTWPCPWRYPRTSPWPGSCPGGTR